MASPQLEFPISRTEAQARLAQVINKTRQRADRRRVLGYTDVPIPLSEILALTDAAERLVRP